MFVLGITGGIGCGKSTAADYFRGKGIQVVDADALSHRVTQKDGQAIGEIVERFGADCLTDEGAVDRAKLSALVFADKKQLDRLSAIIHRHVLAAIAREVKAAAKRKDKLCVLDVPIPVKEGFLDLCDYVLLIWTDAPLRLGRLAARGMDESEALRRMAMQMTREEYAALANETIENDGDKAELSAALDAFCERELLSRGIRF